eukprot:m.295412 g.295412  ORF g.295412 m.295412 type:complete len:105 (-) comp15854_c1_seq1:3679-3993(-)
MTRTYICIMLWCLLCLSIVVGIAGLHCFSLDIAVVFLAKRIYKPYPARVRSTQLSKGDSFPRAFALPKNQKQNRHWLDGLTGTPDRLMNAFELLTTMFLATVDF